MAPYMIKPLALFSFSLLILAGCSVQKPFYNKKELDWETKKMPDVPVKYSVFLLGGMGDAQDSVNEILRILQVHTAKADSNHATIFLSEHVYENGLPAEGDANRQEAQKKIDSQLDLLKDDKGKIFFLGGDHELQEGKKRERITAERTRSYVESKLKRKDIFFPEDGCPGPAEVLLQEDLLLVPVNTIWWLQDKDDRNKNCEINSETEVIDEIKDVIDNNQRKNILVLGHHPFLNIGNQGGFFSVRQHIFPLTDWWKPLYLPLPIVGSLYPLYRAGIGTKHDFAYPPNRKMRRAFIAAFEGYGNVVYVSDHEHNFQYFKYNRQDYIITNSSKEKSWVSRKNRAGFTYAQSGFVKLSLLQNGEVWVEYFIPDKETPEGKVVFRKQLKDNVYKKAGDTTAVEAYYNWTDSTVTLAANENLKAGKVKEFFFGKHWRDAWTTPVEVRIFDLKAEQGGLEIIKKGGGFQTKSLQLKNKKGEEYGLRSVTKYTEEILGPAMQKTWAADIVKDQTSSTHPYAPYVVDDLSKAAGILYSDPEIVYIPNDKNLHEYRKDFANTMALYEQRADGEIAPEKKFGFVTEAISSAKMFEKLHKDHDNSCDDYALLKSRLFDMWINDWDRHQNQWRWGEVKCTADNEERCKLLKAKDRYFIPIPKDRDQAFAKFDGIFPWLAGRKWALRKFQHFTEDIRDVPGINFNARHLDHALLTELSREEWLQMAEELRKDLTDEKIEHAIRQFPEPIYKLDSAEFIRLLKARREHLPSIAERYYEYLAMYVDVLGSDKKEIFEVKRLSNDSTSVRVYAKENEKKGRLLYTRMFKTKETKEIRLYGLGGDDDFEITGKTDKGILVRVVGGSGEDRITDESEVCGWSKKTLVYDTKDDNKLTLGSEARDLTSTSKTVNEYDIHSTQYNLVGPAAFFGYNVDDGVFLGGGVVMRYHGFRKKPYANFQRIVANASLKGFIFNFRYTGDFNNVMGNWGVNVDFVIRAPKSTTNFFGLGNETVLVPDAPDLYYRVRYDQVHVFPAFKRHLGKYSSIKMGPVYDYVKIEKTPDRYISSDDAAQYITDFSARNLLGARVEYELQNIDDSVLTLRGIRWLTAITAQRELRDGALSPTKLESELSLYIPMPNHSALALRAGGAHLIGGFEFYRANTIGGQNVDRESGNLRGYVRGRYAGRSSVYFNADLRIKLISFRTYLFPARFGVLGFYDQGRVWVDDETSNIWHSSYGYGIWLNPFGKAIVNLTYGISKEEKLYTLNIGFLF